MPGPGHMEEMHVEASGFGAERSCLNKNKEPCLCGTQVFDDAYL